MSADATHPATLELLAAFRLASPALPIGGFSYSQGMETAIDRGWIKNEADASHWIADCLQLNIGHFEAPMVFSTLAAVLARDTARAVELNAWYLASRESRELRAESLQMGYSLFKMIEPEFSDPTSVLIGLRPPDELPVDPEEQLCLPLAWGLASCQFGLSAPSGTAAYLWAWAENQVMAAMKCVPLGQQAGQRLLRDLTPVIGLALERAQSLPPEQWSNGAPGFALASAWHETQYSRMFRS